MKNSIKLILISLSILFLSTSISAQSEKQMQRATDDAQAVATALKLDTETQQKIYEINLKTYTALKEIRKEGLPKAEMKVKNKAAWKATREEIKSLLGPDLGKEYKKYLKQLREEKKAKKGKG